jgi:hypothetical protein
MSITEASRRRHTILLVGVGFAACLTAALLLTSAAAIVQEAADRTH